MDLQNRVVVVTGGGRGIGAAVALAAAQVGARVVISARSEGELNATAARIAQATKAEVLPVVADLSTAAGVEKLLAQAERSLGPTYGLVCAAGAYGTIGRFEETSFEEWRQGVEVNLIGVARCMHAFVQGMRQRRDGRIVLFSGGGQGPLPRFSSYVTSKGGIWRLAETLGAEFAEYGVFVNAIAPGAVNTKFLDELLAAGPEKVGPVFYEKSLTQRQQGGVAPERVAECAIYLLSDASRGLYGKTLSAVWDRYRDWRDLDRLSKSDLYSYRRVVTEAGSTRDK